MSNERPIMVEAAAPLPTGVPGLDTVLGGGLHQPSLVSIVGAPGAGKTVLASQILFLAARQNLPGVIFTSRSEGSEQYLSHLHAFSFFHPELLGTTVQLYTLASHLSDPAVSPIAAIAASIRRAGARFVLLDDIHGAGLLFPDAHTPGSVLSALATQVRYLGVTVLVTLAGEVRDTTIDSALLASDTIIGLDYQVRGRQHQRLLDVVKRRGHAQWPGLHSYQIERSGFRVFPRLASYPPPAERPASQARASFGLPTLDRLLGGGLPVGTASLLAGTSGAGKTTLGLTWALAAAEPHAQTLFVTFGEHPDQLMQKASSFGLDLAGALNRGAVTVLRLSPADLNPDAVAAAILAAVASGQVRRLVVDEMALLLEELGTEARAAIAALNQQLYGAQVTSLYLLETSRPNERDVQQLPFPLSVMGDTILTLQRDVWAGKVRNQLTVTRMRLSAFDPTPHELVLEAGQMQVRPVLERA